MQSFNDKVLTEIKRCSKLYKKNLVDYDYLILSKNFKYNDYYILHCKAENYMHLTGLRSKLKALEFFDKCLDDSIEEKDINFGNDVKSKKHTKGAVRRKIRKLEDMTNIFYNENLYFQERFQKNRIFCDIATSDLKCTLGFVGKKKSRPTTLLEGNILTDVQKIDLILKRKKGKKKFSNIVYGNKELLDEFKESLNNCSFI